MPLQAEKKENAYPVRMLILRRTCREVSLAALNFVGSTGKIEPGGQAARPSVNA
jgi:hypothetical protein